MRFAEWVRRAAPAELAFTGPAGYAATLADVDFWAPYVIEATQRHGLPACAVGTGTGSTFPTFLSGSLVVKLFPEFFSGAECFDIEGSIHQLLLKNPPMTLA